MVDVMVLRLDSAVKTRPVLVDVLAAVTQTAGFVECSSHFFRQSLLASRPVANSLQMLPS